MVHSRGIAALTLVFVLGMTALFLLVGVVFVLTKTITQEQSAANAEQALAVAESGAEEVALRIRNGETVPSPLTLTVGNGTATVTNSTVGQITTIVSRGDVGSASRAVELTLRKVTTDVSFHYGVQVGDGGLTMDENSSVNGSIYSDGDIIGDSGATITGDAFVAIGIGTSPDQEWTVYNADYEVGKTTGAVATTIDSGGDVGEYTSLALGSDGFARISYYDTTNKDLKYVRCLDIDCATKNIATVDSGGDVGYRYTSIALGADGFARISYLDNTNDNLKFIRCTNDDCTTRTTTVVDTDDGQYSSMVLGSDGFARIAYYDGDLNFARCLDADCTTRNITEPDSTGDTGQYTSIALGADGFARISYMYTTANDLKFVRCTNADCTTSNVTTVDAGGNIHRNTSLAIGSDGFARMSYMDDGNDDLKFVRCTDADCTTKNITTADTAEGAYSSLVLGSDQFGQITYYNGSDLAFLRCTNADCTTKTITQPDSAGNVGQYTSLKLGSDGFGRASHYDATGKNLKFVRCTAATCPPSANQIDVAQSFQPSTAITAVGADLYLKKVGSPANATLRLIKDKQGSPSDRSQDVLATATITASQVTGSYGWLNVSLSPAPALTANTTYWLVIDTTLNNTNYYVWGGDANDGYTLGTGKFSSDWTGGSWTDLAADLDFRVYREGVDHKIQDVAVNGNANAHIMDGLTVGGNANGYTFTDGTVVGNVDADDISNCTVTGDAAYNTIAGCTIGGTSTTPNTPPADPDRISMPISQAMIDQWKAEAEAGGTISGNYTPPEGTTTLGPRKITGDLLMNVNNQTLVITGTVWVQGDITVDNGSTIQLDPSYGDLSGVALADGWIHVKNNSAFQGSGQPGSYIMLLTTIACTGAEDPNCGHHNSAVDIHNNATGAIFYAQNGLIFLHQNINVTEIVGWGLHLENNSVITYDQGLENAKFSSGPGGGYTTLSWREIDPP